MHHRPADETRFVKWLQPGHLDTQGLTRFGKQQVRPQVPASMPVIGTGTEAMQHGNTLAARFDHAFGKPRLVTVRASTI